MIFRRKKKADEVDETTESTSTATLDDGAEEPESNVEVSEETAAVADGAGSAKPGSASAGQNEPHDWAAFDKSRDWRDDGPFDFDEVDLEADEVERLDFGSLIVTPLPECEVRLQITEGTDQIISVLVVTGDSALELSAYSAPRNPGLWAEIREEIIEQTLAAGGTADCVEGPFSTELVRNLPVRTPDGQSAIQPSRMWMAEGPRWLLRGILMGRAALSKEVDDDIVGPFYDVFADVVVRRGDHPMPAGDMLPLQMPPQVQPQDADPAEPPAQG